MTTKTTKNIGTFKVESGKITVSDPCYDEGTTCMGNLSKCSNGTWEAFIVKHDYGNLGNRVMKLVAHHKEYSPTSYDWKPKRFEVGVDSGQAGIFDSKYYRDDNVVKEAKRVSKTKICVDEPWYSICCDRTLSDTGAGTIPFGCVSSSGFGDGCYKCFVQTKNDKIVAISIDFDDND